MVPRPFLPRPLGRVWEPNYSDSAMTKKHAENMIVLSMLLVAANKVVA